MSELASGSSNGASAGEAGGTSSQNFDQGAGEGLGEAASVEGSSQTTTSQQTKSPARKERIKIDGQELEVDIEELKRDYQKYKASDKRFQEAAELRKQAQTERQMIEQLLERSAQGDLSWLKGLVPEETLHRWAESELLQHLEWQKLPEAEKRAIEAERKAQALQAELEKINKNLEHEKFTAAESQAYQELEAEVVHAIKNLGYDYKVTPELIRHMAEQMHGSLELSLDGKTSPMPAHVAAKRAFERGKATTHEILRVLPVDEALKLIPPSLLEAYRERLVSEATGQMPVRKPGSQESGEVSRYRPKVIRTSTEDFFSQMDKRMDPNRKLVKR